VRLIGESGVARHLDQWALPVDPLPREVETAHEQVAVRARAEHDPELAGEIVSRQSRDRLQLRRMDDAGSLRVEKLASAFDGRDVDA